MTSTSTTMRPQVQRKRRALQITGRVVAAVLLGWVVFASLNIVSPTQGDLRTRSNAVVSLAPQAHRLSTAEQLVDDGNAKTLVISYFPDDVSLAGAGTNESGVPVSDYCAPNGQEGILCFTPEEHATIGEAYTVGDIAQAESWESLTVVTDKYHAFRTRFIFDQCLGDDVDVNVVFADRDLSITQWAWHLAYENVAFVKAVFQTTFRC